MASNALWFVTVIAVIDVDSGCKHWDVYLLDAVALTLPTVSGVARNLN